jgi:hypothetical protein
MAIYVIVTLVLYAAMTQTGELPLWGQLAVNTLLIAVFMALIVKRDFPLSSLPVIGKKFR